MNPATQLRPATTRFDGIDLLRGLSILAVILLHIHIHMYFSGYPLKGLMPGWLDHLIFSNGGNGVSVFFVISGFLITLTSIRRFGGLEHMRPAVFYRIRFARIAPTLFLLLAVLSVLHLAHVSGFHISHKVGTLPQALFAALTFHLNWFEAMHGYLPASWDVLWSLSVEEVFYLVFPLATLLLLWRKHGRRLFIVLLLTFVVMGPFARAIWTIWNDIWGNDSYLGGMDGIALGCLCAMLTDYLLRRKLPSLTHRRLLALQILGAALIAWIAFWPHWHWMRYIGRSGLDVTILSLGVCCVILATVLRRTRGSRWTSPLRWFGRHSYELYLTHAFFVVSVAHLYEKLHHIQLTPSLTLSLAIWSAAILLLSALLAALVARLFSEPMNRYLRGAAPPR